MAWEKLGTSMRDGPSRQSAATADWMALTLHAWRTYIKNPASCEAGQITFINYKLLHQVMDEVSKVAVCCR